MDFRSLVDSILDDLARLSVQQGITGPLAGLLGGAMRQGTAVLAGNLSSDPIGAMISVLGGRASGGPVVAGGMYVVNERGTPELLEVRGKQLLMMGRESGYVTPLMNASSASSGASAFSGRVVVNNMGAPQDYEVGRIIREEIVLSSRDQVWREGPRVMEHE